MHAFQKVFKSVDMDQFNFVLSEMESNTPKIQIYAKSANDSFDNFGILSREQLVQLFYKMNRSTEDFTQTDSKNNEAMNNTQASKDVRGIESNDPDDVISERSSENEPLGKEDVNQASSLLEEQLEISGSSDSNGQPLKSEFDERTEKAWIRTISDETNMRRFSANTSDGRTLKFNALDDDLANIHLSKLFQLPCKIFYDAAADKNRTFKNYIEIDFDDSVGDLTSLFEEVAKIPFYDTKIEFMTKLTHFLNQTTN